MVDRPCMVTDIKNKWPKVTTFENSLIPKNIDTERASLTLCATCAPNSWNLETRFSSWIELLRVTAYIYRYIQKLRLKREKTNNAHLINNLNSYALHPHEIQTAKIFWVKQIQTQLFSEELASLHKK